MTETGVEVISNVGKGSMEKRVLFFVINCSVLDVDGGVWPLLVWSGQQSCGLDIDGTYRRPML